MKWKIPNEFNSSFGQKYLTLPFATFLVSQSDDDDDDDDDAIPNPSNHLLTFLFPPSLFLLRARRN